MKNASNFRGTRPEGEAAMEEFGFEPVPLDEPMAPRPGRVADRLCDLVAELERATGVGDLGGIIEGVAAVRRLVLALDAWDSCVSVRAARSTGGGLPSGSAFGGSRPEGTKDVKISRSARLG